MYILDACVCDRRLEPHEPRHAVTSVPARWSRQACGCHREAGHRSPPLRPIRDCSFARCSKCTQSCTYLHAYTVGPLEMCVGRTLPHMHAYMRTRHAIAAGLLPTVFGQAINVAQHNTGKFNSGCTHTGRRQSGFKQEPC